MVSIVIKINSLKEQVMVKKNKTEIKIKISLD